jgi:hypothetical protein
VWLEKALIGEGDVPTVTDDDVIEETDAEQLAGLFEAAGDRVIFDARPGDRHSGARAPRSGPRRSPGWSGLVRPATWMGRRAVRQRRNTCVIGRAAKGGET